MRCACPETPYFNVSGQLLFTRIIIDLPHKFVKPNVKHIQTTQEIKRTLFNWTKQEKNVQILEEVFFFKLRTT